MPESNINPYVSPSSGIISVNRSLSRLERRQLESWWRHRDLPYTYLELLLLHVRSWITVAAILLVMVVACWWFLKWNAQFLVLSALLLTPLMLGVIARDVGLIRQFIRLWPIMSNVLDWDRIAARLNNE
jgi:hypothetical protein